MSQCVMETFPGSFELFPVLQLWSTFHKKESVVPHCKQTLANFGLDYIDLYLIHWPFAFKVSLKFHLLLACSKFFYNISQIKCICNIMFRTYSYLNLAQL